jgi:hypothetical protein
VTRRIVRLGLSLAAAALVACGSSGGGSTPATFKAQGGKGLTGVGGAGGVVQLTSAQGGNVAVLHGGGVPDLPALTQPAAPDLGANPRTISADLTLASSSFPILGDDGATAATGLWVQSGKTLTLTASSGTSVALTFTAGFRVDGTLVTGPLPTGVPASLGVSAKAVAIGPGGRIDLSGADATGTGPGFAGAQCSLIAQEGVFNQGQVLSRGGRGGSSGAGGAGGAITIVAQNGSALSTGTIDSSGGEGLGGAGGAAGVSVLVCSGAATAVGDAQSAGRRVSRGGSGTTAGGNGGTIVTQGCPTGRVMISGLMDGSGGDATVDGKGGDGGTAVVAVASNRAFVAGQLLVTGGKGASSGIGGQGGIAEVIVNKTTAATPASQGIFLTAQLDVSGGDGATGGAAGVAFLNEAASDLAGSPGTTVVVSGHQSIDASGGQGATAGGGGGHLVLVSARNSGTTARIGSVTSELPLLVNGGQGLAGAGGAAGTIDARTDGSDPKDIAALDRAVTVTGSLSAVGGEGTAAGGAGGVITLYEHFKVDARGAIDASGGRGGSAQGGGGGHVVLTGEGAVSTGTITASGGASQANQGGGGGTASANGARTTVAGAVTADGGAGGTGFGGGGGGTVTVSGTTETHVNAVCSVRAGASALPGTLGNVVINGVDQPLTDGQYRP